MPFDPYINISDPRILNAAMVLRELIAKRYPEAEFAQAWLDDPEGLHLAVTLPHADPDALFTLVSDRLLSFHIEDRLPLYVVFLRPPGQVLKKLRNARPALPPQASP